MKTGFKVFLACAAGAFVGTLVAMQFNHAWWLGLIAGAAVGYLSYETKAIAAAAPRAYASATSWRPDYDWWRNGYRGIMSSVGTSLTLTIGLGILLLPALFKDIWRLSPDKVALNLETFWGTFLAAGILTGIIFGIVRVEDELAWNPLRIYFWEFPKLVFWTLLKFVFWTTPTFLYKHRRTILTFTLAALLGVVRFVKALFCLIHSEIRVLCAVDAAIGAAIGYHWHSALIGALAGGLLGVANYEFFSIRVLKLVPATQSMFNRA